MEPEPGTCTDTRLFSFLMVYSRKKGALILGRVLLGSDIRVSYRFWNDAVFIYLCFSPLTAASPDGKTISFKFRGIHILGTTKSRT